MTSLFVDAPRTRVMGIVNVTADSFSDGGQYLDTKTAIDHALALHEAGVDLVDVGGESTRPGAVRIDADVEAARVVPVIRELAAAGVRTSVDTMRASVARAALDAGVNLVNDVSGGRADPEMAAVVAEAKVPWILMHWRSAADYVHRGGAAHYVDVVSEVMSELGASAQLALDAGVAPESIILDPGLGFAKNAADNWELLRALPRLQTLGYPVLVGASRKRFLGSILGLHRDQPPAPSERDQATAVVSALSVAAGAWGVRVHDALSTLDAVAIATAWRLGREPDIEELRA